MRLAITGGKGGTGKSLVATSLAIELAKKHKTMLVDCDAECPNDHLLLSVKRKNLSTDTEMGFFQVYKVRQMRRGVQAKCYSIR